MLFLTNIQVGDGISDQSLEKYTARLEEEVSGKSDISEKQFGFRKGKSKMYLKCVPKPLVTVDVKNAFSIATALSSIDFMN